MNTPFTSFVPHTETRPWGSFTTFADNEQATAKIITVRTGEEFSLQSHAHRDEFWHIISGNGTIIIGDASSPLVVGADYAVPHDTKHRITAGTENVVFLEISRGEFDENDITRFEDKYGR